MRPNSSTTATDPTRTTKFPRPGFSLFTSTFALDPTALTIWVARFLNADHCLQASIVTTPAAAGALAVSSAAAILIVLVGTTFLIGDFFLAAVFVVTAGIAALAFAGALLFDERVVRTMVDLG